MGLDAYLHSTGKVHRKQSELAKELTKYKYKIWDEKYQDIFKDAPRTSYGEYDIDNFSEKHKSARQSYIEDINAKAKELGGYRDERGVFHLEGDEGIIHLLHYWRKDWTLHKKICELCGVKDKDNLEEIYLSEEVLKRIVDDFCIDETFEYDEYGCFKTALSIVRDGGEVFYFAWY